MTRITVTRLGYLPGNVDAEFEVECDVTVDRSPSHPDERCGGGWETTVENVTARLVEWIDEAGEVRTRTSAILRWGPGLLTEVEENIAKKLSADVLTEHELERV